MDKERKQSFDWLPAQMPRVAALMKAQRAEYGDAHVDECWRRGVVKREPGWFFAHEGALSIGIPDTTWDWKKWPELAGQPVDGAAVLILRPKGAANASN